MNTLQLLAIVNNTYFNAIISLSFITGCPIEGQTRMECASACNITCANVNTTVLCPQVCVVNGCQCPSGTVIDEQTNTCIAPSNCPLTEGNELTCYLHDLYYLILEAILVFYLYYHLQQIVQLWAKLE